MRAPTFVAAFALVAGFAVAPSVTLAQSKPKTHRVKKGDTLELLAAEYYGSRRHAIYIMKANGMTHPRPLRPREALKIPVSSVITARPGDTFSGLAKAHLGDERRAEFLAEHNGLSVEDGLAAGQTLRVPFSVVHLAQNQVSLQDISLSYFGVRKYTDQIQAYNFFETTTVPKGTRIAIPVVNVTSRESTPDKESTELRTKRREAQELAKKNLEDAGEQWRVGRYTEVKELLAGIDPDFLDADQAVAVGVLLGGAYVATGDNASATARFKKALERRPNFKLQTFYYSPKIIDVWKAAGGEVEVGGE